jgi:hypothetical protein
LLQEIQDDLGYLSEEAIVKTGVSWVLAQQRYMVLPHSMTGSGSYLQEKFRSVFATVLLVSSMDRNQ